MELGRVFVSSVFGGMLDLRKLAADAARLVGLEPVLTELHAAQKGSVRDALVREIERCDTYVGVFDKRRGTVPSGTDSRAITEEEFRLARKLGLRCLVFLSEVDSADRDPDLKEFLDYEAAEYSSGVWARPYKDPASLAREIAAALSVLRPRVVLSLMSGGGGSLEARLHLEGVKPAWKGEAVLGPFPVNLLVNAHLEDVFRAFLSGNRRSQLREESLRAAGAELAKRAFPGALGEALETVLEKAAHAGRLVTLEIRTEDGDVLARPWELLSFPSHPLPVRQGLIEVVRHIPSPGEDPDPLRDPAPEVPAERISVLGFTAAPLEDQAVEARLGAGGFSDSDLFWEREQERLLVALDRLVREGRGRLILPDTGDKEELRAQLAKEDRPQVIHLSCHGGTANGKPAVFLEDSDGHRSPVGSDELLAWLRATPKAEPADLLVLSACDSSESAGLAETLVRGGVHRVLGMQSTVSDSGASAFAGAFYAALAQGTDLPAALRAGRAELSAKGEAHEWAIPTLTTSRDAGPLVAPQASTASTPPPAEAIRKDFSIEGVTYLEKGYVGRRELERRLRRAFDRERVIVIHGLGGIGKSTLAARFLERRKEEGARLLILYAGRELAPASLLEEVAKKVGVERSGALPPDAAEQQFETDLQKALREVVPTILLLDNFEDNQDQDGHLRNPALGEALADLVQLGGPGFRLLFTSRLPVELPDLPFEVWNCDLGELSPSGCRKLRLLDPEGLGSLDEDAWRQVLLHLGGHPKALELLGGYLKGKPDRARILLINFGEAGETVDRRLSAKRQERGRSLLVETVLADVPEERLPTFDRLCLLEEPLPPEELGALLAADGIVHPTADLAWLRDHGLLARKVAPSALSGGDAVHRLLASRRQSALTEREGEEALRDWHQRVAEHFVQPGRPLSNVGIAARHRDAAGDRVGALGLYGLWAQALRRRHAYVACVQIAREGLKIFPLGEVEQEKVASATLLNTLHDAFMPLGMIAESNAVLEEALTLLDGCDSPDARLHRARTRYLRGRLLMQQGDPKGAEKELLAVATDLEASGHKQQHAVTLGDIARLRAQAGDVAEARRLQSERLDVHRQQGELDGIANTLYDLAGLDLDEDKYEDAASRLTESWSINNKIGRADGIAFVGQLFGSVLVAMGDPRARDVLQSSKKAFLLLGMDAKANEVDETIQRIQPTDPSESQ
jgi:tetratricopeptide (TPR) repeat protein